MRITGHDAINYAYAHGLRVNAYSDPVDEGKVGLDPRGPEVAERLQADPGLIWIEADITMGDSWAPEPWPWSEHSPLAELDEQVRRLGELGYDATGKAEELVIRVWDTDMRETGALTLRFDAAGERVE